MSRSLLVLLAALALLAGALWYASSTRSSATDDVRTETPAHVSTDPVRTDELVGAEPHARGEESADRSVGAPRDAREIVRVTHDEELSRAHWVEGRVVFPASTPADEEAWVVARGRDFDDGSDHRARVLPDGSFRVAFSERTRVGRLDLDARYLSLPKSARWKSSDEDPVVLEPTLGGRLVASVVLPLGSDREPAGEVELTRADGRGRSESRSPLDRTTVEWGGIAPGFYELEYDGASFVGTLGSIAVEPGRTTEVELRLLEGVSIAGIVVDEAGEPVSGAKVGCMRTVREGPSTTVFSSAREETDEGGAFRLDPMPAGELQVVVSCDGFLDATLPLGSLGYGAERPDVRVVMSRGGMLSGTLSFPDGSPADGARVRLDPRFEDVEPMDVVANRFRSMDERTDEAGHFAISGLAEIRYRLSAMITTKGEGMDETGSGIRTQWRAELDEVRPGDAGLRLVLSSGLHLRGRVIDDRGEPLDEFTISARRVEQDGVRGPVTRKFRASAEGFELEGFTPGEWWVGAYARGHAATEPLRVTLPSTAVVELRVDRGATVRGIVLGADGRPVAGVMVLADQDRYPNEQPSGFPNEARTGPDGAFELEQLRPGQVTLRAYGAEQSPSEPVELDLSIAQVVEGVELRMLPGATLEGEIVNYGPSMQIQVDLVAVTPDAEGRFVATGLGEGTVRVVVHDRDSYLSFTERVVLRRGETSHVRIVVPEITVVTGALTANGEPVAGAKLYVTHPTRNGSTGFDPLVPVSDPDGSFTVGLPSSEVCRLSVGPVKHGNGDWTWSEEVRVSSGRTQRHDISLDLKSVIGRLTNPDGVPLAETADVIAYGGEKGDARCTIDRAGRFELLLSPGRYGLSALFEGGAHVKVVDRMFRVDADLDLGDLVVPSRGR